MENLMGPICWIQAIEGFKVSMAFNPMNILFPHQKWLNATLWYDFD